MHPRPSLFPCLRYRDAPAAIRWLDTTFGFQARLVIEDGQGGIAHAQLALPDGSGMLMLGSSHIDNAYGQLMRHPDQAQGCTQSLYLCVADPQACYLRARAAGADIVIDIRDEDYGGQGFTCRDPEGHLWSLGSYDPWH
ncbi:MAG: hypothetical protein GAK45_00745 [Pseudomonas citronellolis]|nr:MAG: hypothetical protein GAK45_00745 [Pseudomonas citronellolis]